MPASFLSSEEYDERAHRHYDEGEYEEALRVLREGLSLYPNCVELHVGMGFAHLAREDFVWAKRALETSLVLDPENEDALAGLGEVLLRFGERKAALETFQRVRESVTEDDVDMLLSIGRALYREQMFAEACDAFREAADRAPDSPEALSGYAYTLHRLGDESGARRHLRRALKIDPDHYEARIYLGHLLYDRGHWVGALREFESVAAEHHWDAVALWRLLELKRALFGIEPGDERLTAWEHRLSELEVDPDPVDELLAEVESGESEQELEEDLLEATVLRAARSGPYRVCTPEGDSFAGTWDDIVHQLHARFGRTGESLAEFMRRRAAEIGGETGARIPDDDPEAFLLAHAGAGLLRIEL